MCVYVLQISYWDCVGEISQRQLMEMVVEDAEQARAQARAYIEAEFGIEAELPPVIRMGYNSDAVDYPQVRLHCPPVVNIIAMAMTTTVMARCTRS
eukprot:SAG25_NODE_393_length_8567_cov_15.363368_11_plen_96_part_00